jgi:hypothetical protein
MSRRLADERETNVKVEAKSPGQRAGSRSQAALVALAMIAIAASQGACSSAGDGAAPKGPSDNGVPDAGGADTGAMAIPEAGASDSATDAAADRMGDSPVDASPKKDASPAPDGGSSCNTCVDSAEGSGGLCEAALTSCNDSSGCATLIGCVNACTSSACADTCFGAASSSDVELYQSIITCVCTEACTSPCASECTVSADAGPPPACSPSGAAEFQPCTAPTDCECPLTCAFDPGAGENTCEQPCNITSDCSSIFTVCSGTGGSCVVNFCQATLTGAAAPGTYDSLCNAAGTNDGTCFEASEASGANYGVCTQGGTATSATCVALDEASRADSSTACPAGQLCFPLASGNTCLPVCDPTGVSGSPCATGTTCTGGDPADPQSGACM